MKIKHLIAAGVASLVMTTAASAQSLGVGAGRQGSQNYAASAALGKFLSEDLGLDVRVQSYGGSGQTLPLIDSGRLDLAIVPGPDMMSAALGQVPFEGRAMENLRVLANLGPSFYGFMVAKDSDMTMVSDARGRTVTYGFAAQPSLALQADAILAAGGLTIDDVKQDNVPSVPNGVDDLISGTADVAYFAIQGGKAREADAAIGIKWLKLEDTPENEAAMQKVVPLTYIDTVEPGAAPGIDEPMSMMAYDYMLVAGAHVDDAVIQRIVEAVAANPDKVQAMSNAFAAFSTEKMQPKVEDLVVHPGAAAFYEQSQD
ncbi:MAG: TAXI family TRAP transporter solute-binding subunit [Pseudomonadota bacterium]|nr:TAXI family TRAP transporter solute-binding subunit [Pseudomonadota bacterium]MEE2859688.1 TAXI family TRAP transporter solute-binding subunit [Pseudomonadota bacterium]